MTIESLFSYQAQPTNHLYSPQQLVELCEYSALTSALKSNESSHFPLDPALHKHAHIIVHFEPQEPAFMPHQYTAKELQAMKGPRRILLQYKSAEEGYGAMLLEEMQIGKETFYMVCDVEKGRYLHNRAPGAHISKKQKDRFFQSFANCVYEGRM
jgi:hypothetical protein